MVFVFIATGHAGSSTRSFMLSWKLRLWVSDPVQSPVTKCPHLYLNCRRAWEWPSVMCSSAPWEMSSSLPMQPAQMFDHFSPCRIVCCTTWHIYWKKVHWMQTGIIHHNNETGYTILQFEYFRKSSHLHSPCFELMTQMINLLYFCSRLI